MTQHQIAEIYERFFRLGGAPRGALNPAQYRRKVTSLRLPGCILLANLVQERKPARVLDLGSGMTTIILRELQREMAMVVVTTDTSQDWLDTTMKELRRDRLNMDYCFPQGHFEDFASGIKPFDLISVDCGNLDYRIGLAPKLAEWCAPDGMLVLDDMRMREYGTRMQTALQPFGFTVTDHPETRDAYGQTVGTAVRANA